ncbi:DUF4810 domain-containing protein [Skermanella sp. TT6]|uniref:DUF4810 domain-containing protein n=1 Tax=Skermanella cutis TaxID=2775420 RepID=A0ABX7B2S2_9PROT|nr:DUF4810 domain-containing protein [Skermanella sp. TT6]QQP88633.1 DUF4810 domain-containing protein [Skermanella sp. TT6]
MKASRLSILAIAVICAGCGQTTKYYWGNYSKSLYDYQQNPTTQASHQAALESIIASGEPTRKVPPGIYAELGYLKLSSGDSGGAIALFEKEKSAWPESALMMDKAVLNAREGKDKPPAATGVTPASLPTS